MQKQCLFFIHAAEVGPTVHLLEKKKNENLRVTTNNEGRLVDSFDATGVARFFHGQAGNLQGQGLESLF